MNVSNPQQSDTATVGLVGLGLLGSAIAEMLASREFQVVGFDIDPDKMSDLRNLGGWSADSPAHVAHAADRIVLSLPDSEAVLDVVEGSDGICTSDRLPQYIIDTTTGDPDTAVALADRLGTRGVAFVDATVSGSSNQMRRRNVALMVGGRQDDLAACRDILDALSGNVFHFGPPGAGSRAKLASNLILGLNRTVLAEGLVFAEKLGLDLEMFLRMLRVSPAYSMAMDAKGDKMLSGDFSPQSRIRQHRKDISLMLKYARQAGQELPLSTVHLDLLEQAIRAGDADLDNAAVIREIRRRRRDPEAPKHYQ